MEPTTLEILALLQAESIPYCFTDDSSHQPCYTEHDIILAINHYFGYSDGSVYKELLAEGAAKLLLTLSEQEG